MLKFGIDWDDVISDINEPAVELANMEYKFEPALSIEEIDSWQNDTGRASVIKKYYDDERLYDMQFVTDEAKAFLNKLRQKGEVYIVTAVAPKFMAKRVEQIKKAFPDFPDNNIIMGFRKSLLQFDITLDDKPENILKSQSRFPVLMRRPWNRELTGVLSVNNYDEFFQLIEQIKSSMIEDKVTSKPPAIIALVGPSGSNKKKIARELLRNEHFVLANSHTTNPNSAATHIVISKEEFLKQKNSFVETTMYAGHAYGTTYSEINCCIKEKKYVVMPLDMCGAIAMKRLYPTIIIFCKCSRETMIKNILEKEENNHEKMLRLISIENELKNAELADYIVNTEEEEDAVMQIKNIIFHN